MLEVNRLSKVYQIPDLGEILAFLKCHYENAIIRQNKDVKWLLLKNNSYTMSLILYGFCITCRSQIPNNVNNFLDTYYLIPIT